MSKKPYYKHCGNCEYCHRGFIYDYICEIKHTYKHKGRLRALFCKFFKMRSLPDQEGVCSKEL